MSRHQHALIELISSIDIPCWASGTTAAALHGFDGFTLRPPFHVMVEHGHNVRRIGHQIHTSDSISRLDQGWVDGVPVLSPSRALLDIACAVPRERLIIAINGALRDGLTSEDFLHRRVGDLRVSGRSGVRPLLSALEGWEIRRGGDSWLEREFLRITGRAGLPRPVVQQVLGTRRDTLIRVDCRYPGTNLVVELLGYRWHRTQMQMQVDAERLNRLQMNGFVVLQFTYRHVTAEPEWVLASVREALGLAPAAA
jgi:hypothetical protein